MLKRTTIFLDGDMVRADQDFVESLLPGVISTKGVFETMRVHEDKIFFLQRHLRRMSRGLKVLNLSKPVSSQTINKHIRQLLRVNDLRDARVRLTVWREGNRARSSIVCEKIKPITRRQYQRGFKAVVASLRHHRRPAIPVKSLDYGIFLRAYRAATAAGFDEALLLNRKGELVEGSRTNIFLVKQDTLYTPPVRCGCLAGVTRQAVIRCARELGVRCAVKPLKARHLLEADEAFLTNAILGVMPLTYTNRRVIGPGKPGPITLQLYKAYHQLIQTSEAKHEK